MYLWIFKQMSELGFVAKASQTFIFVVISTPDNCCFSGTCI